MERFHGFGLNDDYQLGIENEGESEGLWEEYIYPYITEPTLIPFEDNIKPVNIFLGNNCSFVLSEDGDLYSFGCNGYGQLGIGNDLQQKTPQLVILPEGVKVSSASFKKSHLLFIGTDGNLYGMGQNNYGQLGLGDKKCRLIPTKITLPNEVKPSKVSVGGLHSLVLGDDGNLYFAGKNNHNKIDTKDDIKTTFELVVLPNETKPKLISASSTCSMVLGEDDTLYGWGANVYNELGVGDDEKHKNPTPTILKRDLNHPPSYVTLRRGGFYFRRSLLL